MDDNIDVMTFKALNLMIRVVFILFLVILITPSYAQFLIGPKAGFQMSKVSYKDKDYSKAYNTTLKPGFNAGLVLNYEVSPTFSLHTELFYSRKGKVEKDKESDNKNVAAYHYLDLPMMLRVSHHRKIKKQNVEFYFNLGPSFGYWLGGKGTMHANEFWEYADADKIKYKIKFEEVHSYGETEFVPNPNRLQIEVNLGGGLVFDMQSAGRLMVDFRYGFGIGHTYLGEKDGGDFGLVTYFDNFEGVNHVISISTAYLYEFNLFQALKKGKTIRK